MTTGPNGCRESTACARELGGELRRIRECSGLRACELAKTLGWDSSTVSRLESGNRGTSEVHNAIYLASCCLGKNEMEQFLNLARATDDGYWLRPHGEQLPDELRSLIGKENPAGCIVSYEPLLIPGLLQTEDYARGLFRWFGRASDDDVELKLRARMEPRSLLDRRNPPPVDVLHAPTGVASPRGNGRDHERASAASRAGDGAEKL